jgi:hypothetical protein
MKYQRDGNFRDILFLPRVRESHFACSTTEVSVTAGCCVADLFEEYADVRVGVACRRMSGCVGGGSSLDVSELPFKLVIPIEQRKEVDRANRRVLGGL